MSRPHIPVSTLEVRWDARRTGNFWPFVDFVVDGRSLLERLGSPDQITSIEGEPRPVTDAAIRQLLLLEPTELVEGRQAIYQHNASRKDLPAVRAKGSWSRWAAKSSDEGLEALGA